VEVQVGLVNHNPLGLFEKKAQVTFLPNREF
jgi:hypothetical protein